jgi:hypothetical protein
MINDRETMPLADCFFIFTTTTADTGELGFYAFSAINAGAG